MKSSEIISQQPTDSHDAINRFNERKMLDAILVARARPFTHSESSKRIEFNSTPTVQMKIDNNALFVWSFSGVS